MIKVKFCVLLFSQLLTSTTAFDNHEDQTKNISIDSHEFELSKKHINTKLKVTINEQNIDEAIKYGFDVTEHLITVKEPLWYEMGLVLDKSHPASKVAEFGRPNEKALKLSHFGMAALETTKKIIDNLPENMSREIASFPLSFKSKILVDDCPLNQKPRCPISSRKYRTFDGSCNNILNPWRGSSMLPMQRFLPPIYEDGIQSVRRSVLGTRLASAREISSKIHKDKNQEHNLLTLMFMQWGQFIDHDVTSVVKSRGFNGSVPRCCTSDGRKLLPKELSHPSCLPIEIPENDWFFGKFDISCMEFLRSAPSTRINCDLGWREQINQATSFIDASTIYGNDLETADTIRTFRRGKIFYGRPLGDRPLQPPDPLGGELCNAGALTTDCFETGDTRVIEQPGLTAIHTVWIRYHNKIATQLSRMNPHWTDEKVYQETRRIVYSLIQHITYKEFLPVLLGREVIQLFDLDLISRGYYVDYNPKVDPMVANAFSTAAYRFGHSMVQNSYVRFDGKHRPIFNNVSLHDEFTNFENIWSFGSVDRTLLGFCNQPSQRRDEFICDELSNHLFQSTDMPFGMDLAAINIQRGRDHGIPPYTSWREPCGLTPVRTWDDLNKIFSLETVNKFRSVYSHVDDIDLFSAGLAEKPVKGAVVGPTFACIIAQQFVNLRKGDRFWYENGNFASSFTPAQLQQIRRATFSSVLCQTLDEIETIQPFVFLAANREKNSRLSCEDPLLKNFDLFPWKETDPNREDIRSFSREGSYSLSETRRNTILKNRKKEKPSSTITTSHTIVIQNSGDSLKTKKTEKPLEVNIKIEYYPPSNQLNTKKVTAVTPAGTFASNYFDQQPISYPVFLQLPPVQNAYNYPSNKPSFSQTKPIFTSSGSSNEVNYGSDNYRPLQIYHKPKDEAYNHPVNYIPGDDYGDEVIFEDTPFVTSNKPTTYKPITNHFLYNDVYVSKKPIKTSYDANIHEYFHKNKYQKVDSPVKIYSKGYVQKVDASNIDEKLDFKTRLVDKTKQENKDKKFVKISSIKLQSQVSSNVAIIDTAFQREGEIEITEGNDNEMRLVEMDVAPTENDDNNWLVYNETEEVISILGVPNMNTQTDSTEDLPRPIEHWRKIK
ncbi:peroxidase-like [Diorhabda carinulata]|uniref:peroxidase-like n=1 Tax=Diorhabda carinulata TaxID=1163345 RepID=UPI0025A2D1AE|nr:peroxidase-like [Diorhabda carinulata]